MDPNQTSTSFLMQVYHAPIKPLAKYHLKMNSFQKENSSNLDVGALFIHLFDWLILSGRVGKIPKRIAGHVHKEPHFKCSFISKSLHCFSTIKYESQSSPYQKVFLSLRSYIQLYNLKS